MKVCIKCLHALVISILLLVLNINIQLTMTNILSVFKYYCWLVIAEYLTKLTLKEKQVFVPFVDRTMSTMICVALSAFRDVSTKAFSLIQCEELKPVTDQSSLSAVYNFAP